MDMRSASPKNYIYVPAIVITVIIFFKYFMHPE